MVADVAYLQDAQHALEHMNSQFQAMRSAYRANPMPSADERRAHLAKLRKVLFDNQDALIEAMRADFSNRAREESLLAEIMPSLHGIDYVAKRLKKWMKPSRRSVGLAFQPASARVMYQPKGLVGVIVPWNYPLYLAVGPLAGALAAGNRVMLKMSEFTPATSQLFKELIAQVFDEKHVCVVLGEAEVGAGFSKLPFDHLLFTGSTAVGRHVMRAAADNLTPVTLELGGKSPAIIGTDANMADAAERMGFGKAMNAGQTCVAPDYVLVPRARQQEFVEAWKQQICTFYPEIETNPDYTAIINERQLARLQGYLTDAKDKGAEVIALHKNCQGRRLQHHLVLNVNDDMKIMQDEIFGPLLPVIPYDSLEQAVNFINDRDRPLALYYFGGNKQEQTYVLEHTHSGGVCINDALLHVAQDDMPFGGVGPSGMGHYHGHEGFKTFSHAKSIYDKPTWYNGAKPIYPPYGTALQKLVFKLFIR